MPEKEIRETGSRNWRGIIKDALKSGALKAKDLAGEVGLRFNPFTASSEGERKRILIVKKGQEKPEEISMKRQRAGGLGAHEVRWEKTKTDEGEEVEIPIYEDLDLPTIQEYLSDHLDGLILADRSPNIKSYYEWKEVYGLVKAAMKLGDRAKQEAKEINTEEARKKAEGVENQAKDIRMEYEAVKGALMWYLDAATQFDKDGGGFSKGEKTFNDGVTMGKIYSADLMDWLKTNKRRGKGFIRGFATPRSSFKNVDFDDPNEYLGAQLRASIGIGTKDDIKDPKTHTRKIDEGPHAEAGAEYITHDGTKIMVVKANGQVVERTGPSNGDMYEVHKRATMATYAFKYVEKRHKMMDLIYEYSHSIPDPRFPNDRSRDIPVYICHLDPERMWTYDALQNPKYMGKFWYGNIDILASDACNTGDLPEGERGRDFLKQLGWRDDLDPNPHMNDRLNKLLLSDGDNFLNRQVSIGQGGPLSETDSLYLKRRLCNRFGLNWDDSWNLDSRLDVLEAMGMVRRYRDRVYGTGEYKLPYIMTLNLMNLQDYKIPEKIWAAMDWSKLPMRYFLNDWCMQLNYLIPTTNALIHLIEGEEIRESLVYLGSGEGYKYIPEIIAPFAEQESMHWFNEIDSMELAQIQNYKEGGNRHNLAVEIRGLIPTGFMRGFFRRVWFAACGISNMDWAENLSYIKMPEKVRQFLQGMNEVKVVRDGFLRGEGVTYEELVNFAGLEVKPFHGDLRYHYDLIHMLSDEQGWDTEGNMQVLKIMQIFIDDYQNHYEGSQEILGLAGEKTKDHWVEVVRDIQEEIAGRRDPNRPRYREREETRINEIRRNLNRLNEFSPEQISELIQKTLGIFEEWETEVDLPLMNEFLEEFFRQNSPDRETRLLSIENWIKANRGGAERIFQVWPEFVEMKKQDWVDWQMGHQDIVEKIEHMTIDWPGRHVWNWGTMEKGHPGTGAEKLEMAQWGVGEDYVSRFYEHSEEQIPSLLQRRYGPKFNLWEREKRVFRVMRRQKASMDLRPNELKKWTVFSDKTRLRDPQDIIVGRWFYDQLEWNPVPPHGELKRHDRFGDPLGGLDPIKSMLMVTGEYFPGDPREVSPLWYGHSARRLLYRFASRYSPWYHIEHAKLAAKVYNVDWKEYWREHTLARLVMAPSKWYKVLRILTLSGTIDPNEHVPYERAFGCTRKEVNQYWAERRGLRFPDEQDVVKGEVSDEVAKYAAVVSAELKKAAGGTFFSIITAGRTGTEIARIGRNATILGTAGLAAGVALGLGPLTVVTAGVGAGVGILAGWDRGDLVGGFSYVLGRFGGFLGDRLQRSDPESLALGYVPFRILGNRLPWGLERNGLARAFFPPPVTDDVVNGEEIAQAIATSKAQLGGEGPKGK